MARKATETKPTVAEPVPPPAPVPPLFGHTVIVREVDNPMYPWLVSCTCNYQAHCKTEAQADYWRRSHEGTQRYLQASKGYQTGHI
jgi:hypothetical protein